MIGVPSASARGTKPEQRAAYHVYEVCPSSHGWEVRMSVRGYSLGNHCFVAGDQRVIRKPGSVMGSLDATVHPHGYPTQNGQRA